MAQSVVINRLYMGTSGQAPWLRRAGTVNRGKNTRFDLRLGGAAKRGPTELIADLVAHGTDWFEPTQSYLWFSIRSAILALCSCGTLHGWTDEGVPLDIIDTTDVTDGWYAYTLTTAGTVEENFDVTSDFDTAIVCNRNIVPAFLRVWTFKQSYNYIKNGNSEGADVINVPTGSPVTKFSDLPFNPVNGDVYNVLVDENLDPAGWYVHFSGSPPANYEEGYFPNHGDWYRIPKGGTVANQGQIRGRYDPKTMPHKIVFDETAGTLTISTVNWRQRISGTPASNALMPWVTKAQPIASVEFWNGHLMLCSKSHVTGSRKDDYFNLWNDSVNALGDNDRIIANITYPKLNQLLRARACGYSLLCVFQSGQASFDSGDAPLTNVNGRITPITSFPSRDVKPASAGSRATVIDRLGDVHQYTWAIDSGTGSLAYSALLSAHQWDILDAKTVLALQTLDRTTFVIVDAEPALVHDSFELEGKTLQSAWASMETIDPPVFFDAWDDHIRVVTRRDNTSGGYSLLSYVHREVPSPAGRAYIPHMDRQQTVQPASMTYDAASNRTTISHTGRDGDLDLSRLVTEAGEFMKPLAVLTSGAMQFDGQLNLTPQIIGFQFDCELELTTLYPELSARNIIAKGLNVFHYKTTDYEFNWTPQGGPARNQAFQAARVGVAVIGAASLDTHVKEFGFHTDPRRATVILSTRSPGPCVWLALEYLLMPQSGGKT